MKLIRIISALLSLILICALLGSCKKEAEPCDFTLCVKSEGGALLEGVDVFVYTDETKSDLVWAGHTDDDGETSFNGEKGASYCAFLENVPAGYKTEESYTFSDENSEIKLSTSLFSPDEKNDVIELGGVFCDFTVTAADGTEYTLSQLLKKKKAVVLNFWFHNCGPCRMEFPHLQAAYEDYSDDLEVIAINPVDGTDSSVLDYADELGLSFPVVVGDDYWVEAMGSRGYPTTVVIDRYGTVGFVHSSAFSSEEDIAKLFDFFTDESYTQTTVRNLSDINDVK